MQQVIFSLVYIHARIGVRVGMEKIKSIWNGELITNPYRNLNTTVLFPKM